MPPPPAPQKTPWLSIALVLIGASIAVGVGVGIITSKDSVAAPPSPVPTVAPSLVELPAATPLPVADPMDETMAQLHQDIYVQQFCNMADSSGIDHFADLIDIGKPWKVNSIGSAWVAAENKSGESVEDLATEFYARYC